MAHAWNACWVNALGGSNPPFSATGNPVLTMSEPGFLLLGCLCHAQPPEPPTGCLLARTPTAQCQAYDGESHLGSQHHRKGQRTKMRLLQAKHLAVFGFQA